MDILGLPHAIMITTADVTDRNGAVDMVDYYCDITDNLSLIKKVLVDGGYTGQNFADEIKRISNAEVEIVKRNELHTFSVIPKRWIVNVLLVGSISVVDFGKIVKGFCKILSK